MAFSDIIKYNEKVEKIREVEYPQLREGIYLDHAGITLPARSLMQRFAADISSNLYGNPHSMTTASLQSTRRIDDVRLQLLRWFNADPDDFDVVFVANATAGVKLIAEALQGHENGFWYGYHKDCHTSLVGVRELASHHKCFEDDNTVDTWIAAGCNAEETSVPALFAYPAQSNLNGRRLPLSWCSALRQQATSGKQLFSLLDAASYVSTSPLDLSDAESAPDFTVLSLYKIFGFPDLGALIVRREMGPVLSRRKYFGGGTVDMVLCLREQWHAKRTETIHDQLEDGTLPIHSIIAAGHAMDVHGELFESLRRVSSHTAFLASKLYAGLSAFKHGNGVPVCQLYKDAKSDYGDLKTQGPIVAFNIRNSGRAWISTAEVEKLAAVKEISLRTGAMCNPGGTASYLELEPWEMRRSFAAGHRCGVDGEIHGGKPSGMIRLSVGAMSTLRDVEAFLDFVNEFFVEEEAEPTRRSASPEAAAATNTPFTVESLTVFPIKSCAGWRVPYGRAWSIHPEGLAWDREWCLVHCGTGAALSQKQHPRMALIRPRLDIAQGMLRVGVVGWVEEIAVPLSADPTQLTNGHDSTARSTKVCGDSITAQVYASPIVSDFFTRAVGVPCQLARFPAAGPSQYGRHSKAHLHPARFADAPTSALQVQSRRAQPILLSNESPILIINRSSLNRLNEQIKATGGKAAHAEVFRANIVVSEDAAARPGSEQPYAEDYWRALQIGEQRFEILGPCRRCQMVCVDQETAVRDQEPFASLAKTRRSNGKVFFGQHACHMAAAATGATRATAADQDPTITVGDRVTAFVEEVLA